MSGHYRGKAIWIRRFRLRDTFCRRTCCMVPAKPPVDSAIVPDLASDRSPGPRGRNTLDPDGRLVCVDFPREPVQEVSLPDSRKITAETRREGSETFR